MPLTEKQPLRGLLFCGKIRKKAVEELRLLCYDKIKTVKEAHP